VTPRGNADGCEFKELTEKVIRKNMKTKGGQSSMHGGTDPLRERSKWEGGYHPRDDRKSAEAVESRRDNGVPLRKRLRNRMKLQGLQGCDRKEKT
jgi:hypothetical protein